MITDTWSAERIGWAYHRFPGQNNAPKGRLRVGVFALQYSMHLISEDLWYALAGEAPVRRDIMSWASFARCLGEKYPRFSGLLSYSLHIITEHRLHVLT